MKTRILLTIIAGLVSIILLQPAETHTAPVGKIGFFLAVSAEDALRIKIAINARHPVKMILSDPQDPESELVPEFSQVKNVRNKIMAFLWREVDTYEDAVAVQAARGSNTPIVIDDLSDSE